MLLNNLQYSNQKHIFIIYTFSLTSLPHISVCYIYCCGWHCYPQHTPTSSNSSKITADSSNSMIKYQML